MSAAATVRLALWSGPRNISTAMMRAFENRPDATVVDEPFYAAWLAQSGADHPMRTEVLASQPTDYAEVARSLLGPVPGGKAIFYQKHMAHHMPSDVDLGWMAGLTNAFLIRAPEEVLASYVVRRGEASLEDIGVVRQYELFDGEAQRIGRAPPVIDSRDVLADPRAALSALCSAVGIPFLETMLTWPAGRRQSDGVWAPAWYDAVERSTGFTAPRPLVTMSDLEPELRAVAEVARPYYQRLARYRIGGSPVTRTSSSRN